MPLILPPALTLTPVTSTLDDVLAGPRVTDYRFEVLDTDENLLGTLPVQTGGSLDWSAYSAIKGSGTITVNDMGEPIDWLNIRIRPLAILSSASSVADAQQPLGVFLTAAPVEKWTATGRVWDVELLDKLSVPDQDVVTDFNGDPVTYVAPVGANVIELVVDLLAGVGEAAPAIEPGTEVLAASQTWDVGTSVLKIIDDLLDTAGYFSLWCDGYGQYRTTKYVPPVDRVPVYTSLAPFSKGPSSLMSPDWTRDRDIYSVPNRYVAVGQGDETTEALVAVATNTDPASPFSYPNRGRWITRVMTGIEAVDLAALELSARRGLGQASSITSGISASHLYLPDLVINSTVRFVNPDADLDMICVVNNTSIKLDPAELCTSELREVVT